MLALRDTPHRVRAHQDAPEDVNNHEEDFHSLVCACVPQSVLSQDHADVHEGVRGLGNEHTLYDVVAGHSVGQRQAHTDDARPVVE